MDSVELTNWFPPRVTPVRDGVYQTKKRTLGEGFSCWWRGRWSNQYNTKSEAMRHRAWAGVQEKHWRGLAQDTRRMT